MLTKSEVGGYELRSAVESEANDGRSCSLVECDAEATLSRALMLDITIGGGQMDGEARKPRVCVQVGDEGQGLSM